MSNSKKLQCSLSEQPRTRAGLRACLCPFCHWRDGEVKKTLNHCKGCVWLINDRLCMFARCVNPKRGGKRG